MRLELVPEKSDTTLLIRWGKIRPLKVLIQSYRISFRICIKFVLISAKEATREISRLMRNIVDLTVYKSQSLDSVTNTTMLYVVPIWSKVTKKPNRQTNKSLAIDEYQVNCRLQDSSCKGSWCNSENRPNKIAGYEKNGEVQLG